MQILFMNRIIPTLGHCGALWILLGIFGLPGCSMVDALLEPDPTKVELKLEASEQLNPDLQGRPSPLVTRIYELKSIDVFSNADFFTIYHNDTAALGGDIEVRKELKLKPGEIHELSFEPKPDTQFVAIFGAFRDEAAQWRAYAKIPPNQTTPMTIVFSKTSVQIKLLEPDE